MDDLLGFRDDEEENGEAKGLHVVLVLVLPPKQEFSYLVGGGGS